MIPRKDLSGEDNSLTARFTELLTPSYHNKSVDYIKSKIIEILEDETVVASIYKKKEIILYLDKINNRNKLFHYITNIIMKGSRLSTNFKREYR